MTGKYSVWKQAGDGPDTVGSDLFVVCTDGKRRGSKLSSVFCPYQVEHGLVMTAGIATVFFNATHHNYGASVF